MRIKICGITQPEQGRAIAQLGATALGFICVPQSPRYLLPEQIRVIVDYLPIDSVTDCPVDCVGVFADALLTEVCETVAIAKLSAVQLHGRESPQFCQQLRAVLPTVEIIKALRIRSFQDLEQASFYVGTDSAEIDFLPNASVDSLLLDAYHPSLLGGTGKTLDWSSLQKFRPPCPWILAGGITPSNVLEALRQVQPQGIDLSSGVEHSPGNKDLAKVAQLFAQLKILEGYKA
jgi:phosphoribosylanthranilate isomerase